MRRREFIAGLAGAAAWPVVARAQRQERVRHVAALMGWNESDPEYRSWIKLFVDRLAQLGWVDGQNARVDQRWGNGEVERMRSFAKELVELKPDVIFVCTTPATAALHRETRNIPIVFVVVSDPVGAGFVRSLPRPSGNITGFINVEAGLGSKWLELLHEIAPSIRRVAIMYNPDTAPGNGRYFLPSFEAAARSLSVEPLTAAVHSDADIEAAINSLGQTNGGLVVMTDSFTGVHHGTIISAAARNKVPTTFDSAHDAREGGLLSYGPNYPDIIRRGAAYVDRILRGTEPGDLPVEVPTKFDLAINLKTAKALDLTVPQSLLALADEVIE
jgi:putative tryptophan/tyrosine transport system substrate-binding protein